MIDLACPLFLCQDSLPGSKRVGLWMTSFPGHRSECQFWKVSAFSGQTTSLLLHKHTKIYHLQFPCSSGSRLGLQLPRMLMALPEQSVRYYLLKYSSKKTIYSPYIHLSSIISVSAQIFNSLTDIAKSQKPYLYLEFPNIPC